MLLEEYRKDTAIWKEKPATMIQKVAESQALRKAFSASGLYIPEEFGEPEGKAEPRNITPMAGVPQPRDVPPLATKEFVTPPEEIGKIIDADERQMSGDAVSMTKQQAADLQSKGKRQVKKGNKWVDEEEVK